MGNVHHQLRLKLEWSARELHWSGSLVGQMILLGGFYGNGGGIMARINRWPVFWGRVCSGLREHIILLGCV